MNQRSNFMTGAHLLPSRTAARTFQQPLRAEAPTPIAPSADVEQSYRSEALDETISSMLQIGVNVDRGRSVLDRAKLRSSLSERGLSDVVQEKIFSILQKSSDLAGARQKSRSELDEIIEAIAKAKLNLEIERERSDLPIPASEKAEQTFKGRKDAFAKAQTELNLLEDEKRRLTEIGTALSAESAAQRSLSDHLVAYIRKLPTKGSIKAFPGSVNPKLELGETLIEAVEQRRRNIRNGRSDLEKIKAAPFPSTEAKPLVRSQINALAEAGRPNLNDVIYRRGEIQWPKENLRLEVYSLAAGKDGSFAAAERFNSLAAFAWLFRDQIISKLESDIDAHADDGALTPAQRVARSTQVRAEILLNEREEEALIVAMEAGGASFARRPDADPRAVLGLSDDAPASVE